MMQIEDVLKWAINSTVGTSDFKPLDRIITDSKGLVASDNLYHLLSSHEFSSGDSKKTLNTAIMHVNGSVRVKAQAAERGSSAIVRLKVYKNETELSSIYWSDRDDTLHEKTLDISFSKNDVLRFEAVGESLTSGTLSWVGLCADVIDLSGITVT